MTIAFLRTSQADSTNAFNKLEFEAASHGARAGHACLPERRNLQGPAARDAVRSGVARGRHGGVTAAGQRRGTAAADRCRLACKPCNVAHHRARAVPRVLVAERWRVGMAARRPGMNGVELAQKVSNAQVGGPAVGRWLPRLDAMELLAITTRLRGVSTRTCRRAVERPHAIGRNWGAFCAPRGRTSTRQLTPAMCRPSTHSSPTAFATR